MGKRIAKRIKGIIVEKYLWSGRIRLLAVYDGNDNLIMRFNYAEDRGPYSMEYMGEAYYLVYDQVGSLKAVVDSSGLVVKRIDYDSFGNIILDTDPTLRIPIGFAGGLCDSDTGLVHFGVRDYNPAIGRWTAKDPIDFAGGSVNLYEYVLDDPVNWVDPWGLASLEFWGGNLWYLDDSGFPVSYWPAISGPYGKGALPPGSYILSGPPVYVPPEHPRHASFCDPSGNCWWQPIKPKNFCTDRTGLGIHPDGGVPGTSGCIGIQCQDTSDLYNILINNPGLELIVR